MKYVLKTTITFNSEAEKSAYRDANIASMDTDVTDGKVDSWNMDITVTVDEDDKEEYQSKGKEHAEEHAEEHLPV